MIDATADPLLGALVAERYRVLSIAGQGGSARVYRARQEATDRLVALKVMLPGAVEPEALARFEREAHSMAQLRSPVVAEIYDAGRLDDGRLYLALEWIEGPSLDRWLADHGPLGPEAAVALLAPVAQALGEVHAQGLVHRDVKAKNLMLEAAGAPEPHLRLLDFGLVRTRSAEALALTQPDLVYGTPGVMAPELWSNRYGAVGPATDVYAFGVLLFEALTGARPFSGPDLPSIMDAHLRSAAPRLPADHPLAEVVARCLMKAPGDRYGDGTALYQALIAPSPPLAQLETLAAVPRPPLSSSTVARRPWAWAGATVGLLGLLGLVLRPEIHPAEPGPSTLVPAPTPEPKAAPPTPPAAATVQPAPEPPLALRVQVQGPQVVAVWATALAPRLAPCFQGAPRARIHLVLSNSGAIDGLEARPPDPALLACAAPIIRQSPRPGFAGIFATVTYEAPSSGR